MLIISVYVYVYVYVYVSFYGIDQSNNYLLGSSQWLSNKDQLREKDSNKNCAGIKGRKAKRRKSLKLK